MDKNNEYLEHINKLLRDKSIPELDPKLAENPLMLQIHEDLKSIREVVYAFSSGDFSSSIISRGIVPGCLKSLQAHLRHLIWQVQMIEKGDLSQKVNFMGDFSIAFNNMVNKLRHSLAELKENEKNLKENESRLKFLANHDPLTGIYNRRSFMELAAAELSIAAKNSIPCCLAMMDIDHFKNFNDTYGHLAGDEALRHAVKTIEITLRKNDFMGRYGGEEFILFFYDTDEDTGFRVVERLRKSLPEKPVFLKNGPVSIYASFGLVGNRMADSSSKNYVQDLIDAADNALYAAKKAGRNRVILYDYNMKY